MPPMRAESRVATEQLDELAHQLGPPLQHLADRMKQFGQALTQFSLALEEHVAPASMPWAATIGRSPLSSTLSLPRSCTCT